MKNFKLLTNNNNKKIKNYNSKNLIIGEFE